MKPKDIYELMIENNDVEPIDLVAAILRVEGVNLPDPNKILKGKNSLDLNLNYKNIAAVLGLRINKDSDFVYDGKKITYRGNELELSNPNENETYKIETCSQIRGWRPDFYYKGRIRDDNLNAEAVLNLNLINFCDNGCSFCVRTYMNNKMDNYPEISADYLNQIIQKAAEVTSNQDLENVEQISLVSGIGMPAQKDLQAVKPSGRIIEIWKTAKQYGFKGAIMYAGYDLSKKDIDNISETIPEFIWYYTIECFSKRKKIMPSEKGNVNVDEIMEKLHYAQSKGINVSFFYIAGIDKQKIMEQNMERLEFVDALPNVNLFDTYNDTEMKLRSNEFIQDPTGYVVETMRMVKGLPQNNIVKFI